MNIPFKFDKNKDSDVPPELCPEMLIESNKSEDDIPPELCAEMLIESKNKN